MRFISRIKKICILKVFQPKFLFLNSILYCVGLTDLDILQELPLLLQSSFFKPKPISRLLVKKIINNSALFVASQDLNLPVEILAVPTQRESDGLALSSRNRRLTAAQRQQAAQLPRALNTCLTNLRHQYPLSEALAHCRTTLENAGFVVHYLDLRTEDTLSPAYEACKGVRLFVAASLGSIRLIDNMPVF